MRLLIILSTAWIIQAGVVKKEETCTGVIINGVYYEDELLKTGIDRPFLLATDRSRNIVYFSYSMTTEDDVYKSAYVNLNTKEFVNIDEVNNGFAQTVDQKTHDVYIGSNEGIYKYDQKSDTVEFIGALGSNIWCVYYKDGLYYSDFPHQFLYTIVDGQSVRVKDLEDTKIDHFIIDNDDTYFYTNASGLHSQRKGTKDAVFYEDFPKYEIRGLSIDNEGKVYLCLRDGIYRIDKDAVTLEKLVDLDDGFGIAFDSENNIIYSDTNNVFRLKRNNEKDCIKK